jgi:deazaflavin-dependent oxidoreductase (nitroreductase family)
MSEIHDWNARVIEEFRANGGRVGGNFEGATLLLLHTTGARTGAERVNPVVYLEREGRRFVFASKAGADTHPDWYRNLLAHPDVIVELGTTTYPAHAAPIPEPERSAIYDAQVRMSPGFAEYQAKTTRVIPVVELTPTA